MNTSMKMIVVLTVITTLVGGVLAAWDGFTQPKIEQHRLERLRNAVKEVLPQHQTYDKIEADGQTFYVGKSSAGEVAGIAFPASGAGFQGEIRLMIGVDATFDQITGIAILQQTETPGLGTKIVTDPSNQKNPDWFTDQFQGIKAVSGIDVVKNQKPSNATEIQAITGATISSQAVVSILNNRLDQAKQIYKAQSEQIL